MSPAFVTVRSVVQKAFAPEVRAEEGRSQVPAQLPGAAATVTFAVAVPPGPTTVRV